MTTLDAIRTAEAAAAARLNAAADLLDQIGTSTLDAARARLEASAAGVKARLASSVSHLDATLDDVLQGILGAAQAVSVRVGEAPALPAPVAPSPPGDFTISLSAPLTTPQGMAEAIATVNAIVEPDVCQVITRHEDGSVTVESVQPPTPEEVATKQAEGRKFSEEFEAKIRARMAPPVPPSPNAQPVGATAEPSTNGMAKRRRGKK